MDIHKQLKSEQKKGLLLDSQRQEMQKFRNDKTIKETYLAELMKGKSPEQAFEDLNRLYNLLFSFPRFKDYTEFKYWLDGKKPPQCKRMDKLDNIQQAVFMLRDWHKAGFETMHAFIEGMLTVYPRMNEADLACYYDNLVHDADITTKARIALKILTENGD